MKIKTIRNKKNHSNNSLMILITIFLMITSIVYLASTSTDNLTNYFSFSGSLQNKIDSLTISSFDSPRYLSELPDYSLEHLTPISMSQGDDPLFTLCPLNFKKYSSAPHSTPMFKDLLAISDCTRSNVKHAKLSDIKQDIAKNKGQPAGRVIYPSGFIFHESRVGSTLVANLLGSDPFNMIFSESSIPSELLLRCRGCSHEKNVELFRSTILSIGRSPVHKRLFFKFQSITTTQMKIALEAFPDVPWAFVFRHPVQTLMSHLDPKKGGGGNAPCLRSKRAPPEKVKAILRSTGASSSSPNAAWCAAHLNMLCEHAYEAFEKYGVYDHSSADSFKNSINEGYIRINSEEISKLVNSGSQRGFLIDYATLPGILPRFLLQAFGIQPSNEWVSQMVYESQQYSKGARRNSKAGIFNGDSEDKEKRATEEIEKWGKLVLQPTTNKLLINSQNTILNVAKQLSITLPKTSNDEIDWEKIKIIPDNNNNNNNNNQDNNNNNNNKDNIEKNNQNEFRKNKVGISTRKLPSLPNPFESDYNSSSYEEPDCPSIPPKDYPKTYPMKKLLDNWNTDDTNIPPYHFNSLCRFDYQTEYEKALAYRNAEVPFIVYNHPEVDEVVKKWKNLDYLNSKIGKNLPYKTQTSRNNHFMYWRHTHNEDSIKDRNGKKWQAPTSRVSLTFSEWIEKAVRGHNKTLENREHFYFRISAEDESSWIFKELPFFQPKESFFMVQPSEQRGIHCRFGMRSIISECHFDGSRNAIASFGGLRRWILNHPNQCENLYLLPRNHPSGRHSEIDWSKPDYKTFPKFATAEANEIIMRPGEVLYLPTYWFHYIISLNINFQCNTRSGITSENAQSIRKCGFL